MLTLDSTKQENWAVQLRAERQRADLERFIADQIRGTEYLENEDEAPTNAQRQMGQSFTKEELERKLSRLLPNARFEPGLFGSRVLVVDLPNQPQFRLAFGGGPGPVPEHSIIKKKQEDVADLSVTHIERKDLPKSEWDSQKGWVFDESQALPGYRRVQIPWGEAVRGWRTVLLTLVVNGLVTVGDAEREFGTSSDRQWAGHTGKRSVPLIW